MAISLPPELEAAVRSEAGPEGMSHLIQEALTVRPKILIAELKGMTELIARGDTGINLEAVGKLVARIDNVLACVAALPRLRQMLVLYQDEVAQREAEAGEQLSEEVAVETVKAGGGTKC